MTDTNNLHKEFVRLGRERNQITYKLLALLPKIEKLKIYEQEGYANIYAYAAKIAGLSPEVVGKALKLQEKLKDMPHLQKAIETQGIHKVAIVAGLATKENEKELAKKVDNMSKPALQELSKEERGKVATSWQVELDEKMIFMFLKLKKKFGKNLSNKECLRKILEEMQERAREQVQERARVRVQERARVRVQERARVRVNENSKSQRQGKIATKKSKPRRQAKEPTKIPGEKVHPQKAGQAGKIVTRYFSVHQKRNLSEHCSHQNCHRPAEVIHHPDRFSQNHNHKNLKPLCKQHHEFAHNGISEPMQAADHKYRKHRQAALV
ncbi:MAG: hypothetical protein ABID64_05390 [Nitrospirota bacterium]